MMTYSAHVQAVSSPKTMVRDPGLNRSREIRLQVVEVSDKFRPGVVSDVISDSVVEEAGVYVCLKVGDSGSNRCRDIRSAHFVTANDNTPDLCIRPSRRFA